MGCPFQSELLFGIKLQSERAKEINKALDEISANEELGDWSGEVSSDSENKKYYISILDIGKVDNCSFIKSLEGKKNIKEAVEIFNSSSFLKAHLNESDIELLLIARYVG